MLHDLSASIRLNYLGLRYTGSSPTTWTSCYWRLSNLQPLLVVIQLQEDLLGFRLHTKLSKWEGLDVQYPPPECVTVHRPKDWKIIIFNLHDDLLVKKLKKDSVLMIHTIYIYIHIHNLYRYYMQVKSHHSMMRFSQHACCFLSSTKLHSSTSTMSPRMCTGKNLSGSCFVVQTAEGN